MKLAIQARYLFCAVSLMLCGACTTTRIQDLSLASRFTAEFTAKFPDSDAARQAWLNYGGAALHRVERHVYPRVSYSQFKDRALKRMAQARQLQPDLSAELLSLIALDGLASPRSVEPTAISVAFGIRRDATHGQPGSTAHSLLEPIAAPAAKAAPQLARYHPRHPQFHLPILELPQLVTGSISAQARSDLARHVGPLILDLRGNLGGLLTEVPQVAALFIAPDTLVLLMDTGRPSWESFRTPSEVHMINSDHLLVLIDESTDAGALGLAVALQELGGAKIAGSRAPEIKDSVETVIPLSACPPPLEGCALRLPTGILLAPSGQRLGDALQIDFPVRWTGDLEHHALTRAWLDTKL